MTDSRYQQVFGDAMDALYRRIGIDEEYRARVGMFYTVESHTTHRAELRSGEGYQLATRVLSLDDKRLRMFQSLHRSRDGVLAATGEQLYLHVAVGTGRAGSIPGPIAAQLEQIRAAQASEPLPAQAGRAVGQPRSKG